MVQVDRAASWVLLYVNGESKRGGNSLSVGNQLFDPRLVSRLFNRVGHPDGPVQLLQARGNGVFLVNGLPDSITFLLERILERLSLRHQFDARVDQHMIRNLVVLLRVKLVDEQGKSCQLWSVESSAHSATSASGSLNTATSRLANKSM